MHLSPLAGDLDVAPLRQGRSTLGFAPHGRPTIRDVQDFSRLLDEGMNTLPTEHVEGGSASAVLSQDEEDPSEKYNGSRN